MEDPRSEWVVRHEHENDQSKSPNAAISGPPLSRMPISQSIHPQTISKPFSLNKNPRQKRLTAINNSNRHQNTRATSNRTGQVSGDGEKAEDGTAERGRGGDDALELLVEAALTVAGHDL